MNDNAIDKSNDSSSPKSSGDHGDSPKCKKFQESNSPSLSITDNDSVRETEGESRVLKTKLEIISARLSQTELTASKLYEIRREIDRIFNSEFSVLQIQSRVNQVEIEQLRRQLEAAIGSNDELLQALMTAESNLQSLKAAVMKIHVALLTENYQLRTETIPSDSGEDLVKFQEDDREALKGKVRAAEEKIAELEHQLEDNLISQTEFDLQNIELEQAHRTIRKVQSVGNRRIKLEMNLANFNCGEPELFSAESTSANNSEEEQQSSRINISTLHGTMEEKVLSKKQMLALQKILDDIEEAKQVMRLEEKFEELSSRLYNHQSSEQEASASQQTVVLEEPEDLSFQMNYYDPRESHSLSIENEYFNPSDNDFSWYVPDDEAPVQSIDRVRFGDDNLYRKSDEMWKKFQNVETRANVTTGMIEFVPDWLLSPEASSSTISCEDSTSNALDENYGCLSSETNDERYSSNDSDLLEIEEQDPLDHLKLMVGKYLILVSHPKFFQIEWSHECTQVGGNQWICQRCLQTERVRLRIEDHVWVTHYGGAYKCPYCPFISDKNHYKSRSFARGHFKSKHPELVQETEQKSRKNKRNL